MVESVWGVVEDVKIRVVKLNYRNIFLFSREPIYSSEDLAIKPLDLAKR